ncbi:unnamed protein product [Enterobius vermicularis]|uniref:Macro domain-containing protein n=1 Tax=Enterobius vermicularis TaxID=51028 RepID=A0A0N4VCD7_ENTVE|nr:unnamed protein product [Enterobius vermicularis]
MTTVALKNVQTLAEANWAKLTNLLASKISLWQGDITKLEIDAIVNAANRSLRGGGGVDGAIHRAAGPELAEECVKRYRHCATGDAVITSACRMQNVKNIIHTVGPQAHQGVNAAIQEQFVSCYRKSLEVATQNNVRTIAFPCISTGVYCYPNDEACQLAIETVKKFLQKKDNYEKIDRVVFCVFLDVDYQLYKLHLPKILADVTIEE